MDIESIREMQKIAYLIITMILVGFLYFYIYHMYRNQKKGIKDYEKYSRLALDDNIDDEPIEERENKNKGDN